MRTKMNIVIYTEKLIQLSILVFLQIVFLGPLLLEWVSKCFNGKGTLVKKVVTMWVDIIHLALLYMWAQVLSHPGVLCLPREGRQLCPIPTDQGAFLWKRMSHELCSLEDMLKVCLWVCVFFFFNDLHYLSISVINYILCVMCSLNSIRLQWKYTYAYTTGWIIFTKCSLWRKNDSSAFSMVIGTRLFSKKQNAFYRMTCIWEAPHIY